MTSDSTPREYPEWRSHPGARGEDAGYTFGYYMMIHCRDEAMATLPPDCSPDTKAAVETAVDLALHNVCDMLEGFWDLESGPRHSISLQLNVQVRDSEDEIVESVEISPCQLDLPVGYWKWRDREFR